ncbi:hypothetical protein CPB86DRAFT_799777 [Serendipita vermifera]|nr:hypothetical protein CPB86DRAFT_799777 [Serendipita vermifera]
MVDLNSLTTLYGFGWNRVGGRELRLGWRIIGDAFAGQERRSVETAASLVEVLLGDSAPREAICDEEECPVYEVPGEEEVWRHIEPRVEMLGLRGKSVQLGEPLDTDLSSRPYEIRDGDIIAEETKETENIGIERMKPKPKGKLPVNQTSYFRAVRGFLGTLRRVGDDEVEWF